MREWSVSVLGLALGAGAFGFLNGAPPPVFLLTYKNCLKENFKVSDRLTLGGGGIILGAGIGLECDCVSLVGATSCSFPWVGAT